MTRPRSSVRSVLGCLVAAVIVASACSGSDGTTLAPTTTETPTTETVDTSSTQDADNGTSSTTSDDGEHGHDHSDDGHTHDDETTTTGVVVVPEPLDPTDPEVQELIESLPPDEPLLPADLPPLTTAPEPTAPEPTTAPPTTAPSTTTPPTTALPTTEPREPSTPQQLVELSQQAGVRPQSTDYTSVHGESWTIGDRWVDAGETYGPLPPLANHVDIEYWEPNPGRKLFTSVEPEACWPGRACHEATRAYPLQVGSWWDLDDDDPETFRVVTYIGPNAAGHLVVTWCSVWPPERQRGRSPLGVSAARYAFQEEDGTIRVGVNVTISVAGGTCL